jgi:hypothetical protein
MIAALEADQLAAYGLVLDLGEPTLSADVVDERGELIDRERRLLAGSAKRRARVVPDRRHRPEERAVRRSHAPDHALDARACQCRCRCRPERSCLPGEGGGPCRTCPPIWSDDGLLRVPSVTGVIGCAVGLAIGLHAYAPTAWFATFELGIPTALAGGLIGLLCGTVALGVRRFFH